MTRSNAPVPATQTIHHRRLSLRVAALCFALAALALPSWSQEGEDLDTRAAAALQASNWSEAAELYGQVVEARPEDAAAWYRFGLATERSGGDGEAARSAFEKSVDLGFPSAPALVGVARSYATEGNNEAVLKTLEGLAEQGPSSFVISQLTVDDTFAGLESDDSYQALIVQLTPCATEQYRHFDFWLGTWDVVSPQGQPLGTNTITETLDGCMLIENWTSASGGQEGMSINYYDRDREIWTQIFRDNSGNISQWPELTGNFQDGSMVLESPEDAQPRTRWIWTAEEDGRVRQKAESSTDGGETWNVVWDSYYVKSSG